MAEDSDPGIAKGQTESGENVVVKLPRKRFGKPTIAGVSIAAVLGGAYRAGALMADSRAALEANTAAIRRATEALRDHVKEEREARMQTEERLRSLELADAVRGKRHGRGDQ